MIVPLNKYEVTVYERQEWYYTYTIDAADREIAKDIARQLHIDGEQSDDSGIVDGYSTGIDCVDIEIKGEQ
jgi:hypothetical protein